MRNTPDDWDQYYHTCGACGQRYHDSGEDVCDCEYCMDCDQLKPPGEFYREDKCWDCATCSFCMRQSSSTEYRSGAAERLCDQCWWQYCEPK